MAAADGCPPDTEPEKLQADENIRQSLDIDSFDYLQFIIALDEKLGIKTPEADYSKINILRNLLTYITGKMK
jgi:acyl carrier protein